MTTSLTYGYRGRNSSGRVVKGRIDASSQSVAISKVVAMGVSPIEVKEVAKGGLQMEISIPGITGRVKLTDLAVMSRQMATMIQAGISLVTTIGILGEQTENPKLSKTLGSVRTEIEQGHSFSESLAKFPEIFPPIMISLVRAGEFGGFLDESLEAIAINFEKESKLRGSIKSALTYPVVVLCIALLGVIAMLVFIVPVFKTMFENIGSTLPLPTQILVDLSAAMPIVAPILVVVIIAFTIWWARNKHKESVRRVVDPIKLKVPVFGQLNRKIAVARFARNLSAMMRAGVPILRSLAIVGETSGNLVISKAMERVADSVRAGGTVAGPLMNEPVFPRMLTQMLAVGENSGSMDTMLAKVADFYDAEVESTTEQLTTLIEPIMIVLLGVILGGMIVALYMPMFSIIGEVSSQAS
jgi:type IV pilus assembly protein PilC